MQKLNTYLVLFVASLSVYLFSTSVSAKQNELTALDTEHFDSFKVAENGMLPITASIYIADVSADFSRSWLMQYRSDTTDTYRERIKRDYAEVFQDHLKNKLEEAGWTVVDKPNKGALTLHAQIKDLHINGPQKLNRQHIMITNAGHASVLLKVKGTDNQTIFEIEDRRNAGGIGSDLIETDRVLNHSLFSRLTKRWASAFVAYLDLSTADIQRS